MGFCSRGLTMAANHAINPHKEKVRTMSKLWDQYDSAFKQVTAHAVLFAGEHVANIGIKYPRDGAGRVTAYVHWLGREVVRGSAGGGGYDKTSAAIHEAGRKLDANQFIDEPRPAVRSAFVKALLGDDTGQDWTRSIGDTEGFTLLNVIR